MRVAYTVEQCWHEVPGGTAVATMRLAHELQRRPDVELAFVGGRHRRPPVAGFNPPGRVHGLPLARPWLYESWLRFGWPKVESATGPVDLVHATAGIPAATNAPQVVTLHDVAFLRRPDRLTRHGARVLTSAVERARTAAVVMCPSATVRRDLIDHGFDPDQIVVVPWGVDLTRPDAATITSLRHRLQLPERFVLAVATLEPRKNLTRLIEAMGRLDESIPLVVAGADGWGGVADRLRSTAHGADVRFVGHVVSEVLPSLMAAADLLAFPSEDEGFGLPVLEAMAVGTAVVTSRGTATEDVAGEAAVLVDPYDIDAIAAGIADGLHRSSSLSTAGLLRAAQFTWETAAAATVDAYRQATQR